jgi:hypothetical protein
MIFLASIMPLSDFDTWVIEYRGGLLVDVSPLRTCCIHDPYWTKYYFHPDPMQHIHNMQTEIDRLTITEEFLTNYIKSQGPYETQSRGTKKTITAMQRHLAEILETAAWYRININYLYATNPPHR